MMLENENVSRRLSFSVVLALQLGGFTLMSYHMCDRGGGGPNIFRGPPWVPSVLGEVCYVLPESCLPGRIAPWLPVCSPGLAPNPKILIFDSTKNS